MTMKNPLQQLQQSSFAKLFKTHLQLLNLLPFFLLFGSGFTIGIISNSHLKSLPFNLPTAHFSSPPPASPLSPLPPPLPSKTPNGSHHIGIKEFIRPRSVVHDIPDEELLWRASMFPKRKGNPPYKRVSKVAFMFLARGPLHFAPLWEKFFQGNEGLYSIYVHTHPSFNESVPKTSVFHGRRILSKVVQWGELSMVQAERRLLANALLDFSNERFVLLSESCIPLFNFSTIYSYLTNSTLTFIESYDSPTSAGRGRYNRRMWPTVSLHDWRKGSQWFEADRSLAIDIISDRKYFRLFAKFCKPSCYADEHYIQTFVSMKFWWRNSNRSLTWVDWSKPGPHPASFGRRETTVDLLQRMRSGAQCKYNGKSTRVCSLFARKFLPNALDRLMRFAPKVLGIH